MLPPVHCPKGLVQALDRLDLRVVQVVGDDQEIGIEVEQRTGDEPGFVTCRVARHPEVQDFPVPSLRRRTLCETALQRDVVGLSLHDTGAERQRIADQRNPDDAGRLGESGLAVAHPEAVRTDVVAGLVAVEPGRELVVEARDRGRTMENG